MMEYMKKIICCMLAAALLAGTGGFAFAKDNENTDPGIAAENTQISAEQTPEQTQTTEEQTENNSNVINIYVDPKGSAEDKDTFRNLSSAIDYVSKLDKENNQIIVNIKGGTYKVDNTVVFSENASGSSKYPVIYKAQDGEKVIFEAGTQVSGTKLTDDDPVKKRLPQTSKNHVYKVDLSHIDAKAIGGFTADGGGVSTLGPRGETSYRNKMDSGIFLEFAYDGEVMPLAIYPNEGSLYSEKTYGADPETQIELESNNADMSSWTADGDGLVNSIAAPGYYYARVYFRGVDPTTGRIKTTGQTNGRTSAGARIRFTNMPELIDQPGEYCVDSKNKVAYFYPPDQKLSHTLYALALNAPIMTFKNAKNIVVDGITVQNGGSTGIEFIDSENCTLKNSGVKNVSASGILVQRCKNTVIESSVIKDIGLCGIILFENAGGTKTLTSSGNRVENCDIYSIGRDMPVGSTGLKINGEVGAVIKNNRIHDTPAAGMDTDYAYGTNCLIEKNEVYNAANDTYDAGAIYSGAARYFGTLNRFVNNYVHGIHLTEDAKGGSVIGLYWDDQNSGQTAIGNIFADNDFCMLVGGGDANTIIGNVFYNSKSSLTYDNRGEGWQKTDQLYKDIYETTVGIGNSIWDNAYPYSKKLYQYSAARDFDKISIPDEVTVKNNVIIGTSAFAIAKSAEENALDISNNYKAEQGETIFNFADPKAYNFQYDEDKTSSKITDFDYIDFSKIGLLKDKEMGKPQILGPCDGADGIEGNNIVFSWKDCNGADKYRLRISMNKSFSALVYDEVVKGRSKLVDCLKYGIKYYWTVEPVAASKSDKAGYVSDIHTFTTAKNEKKSTKELEELLNTLGNGWKRVQEGTRPGTYKEGAVAELSKSVDEAETVLYNNSSKMFSIKNVTAKLNNAINEFNSKMNVERVDIADWLKDKGMWSTVDNVKSDPVFNARFENDKLHVTLAEGMAARCVVGYGGAQLSRGQLLKFKGKFDLNTYEGWAFNHSESSTQFGYDTGYSLVVKRDSFEIQKRYYDNNHVLRSNIIKTYPNEESIITSDVWYTIETGVLSTVIGPRIIVNVNGKTIVDYIDTGDNRVDDLGYFQFIHTNGSYGMYIAGAEYTE